ncbi:MAG: hypothetical protein L7T84_09345 [Akkermansiaceae bacterium]|nr:hypothetical protein [Akkermansiaceae bacterium]
MNLSELESKILKMLDGELPVEGVTVLEEELLANAESRGSYQKLARLHSALEIRDESRAAIANTKIVPIERVMARQRRRIVKIALSATAAIVLVSVVVLSLMKVPDAPIASFRTSPGSLFTLTHEVVDGEEVPEGQELAVGSRLLVQRGTVEGVFQSGVRVVVEAPCDIRVLAGDRVALGGGVAWFEVPEEAVGFSVETEQLTVIDLGTAFGIDALAGEAHEVHVTRGAVEVTSRVEGVEAQTLQEGEARRVDALGKLHEITYDANRFTVALPMNDGLVGHWEFETYSVGATPDSSGNGHSGHLEGSAKIVTDEERGNVISLSGLSGLGSRGDAVDIDAVREIPTLRKHRGATLTAWIKRNPDGSAGDRHAYIVGLGASGDHPVVSLGISDSTGFVTGYIEGETGDKNQVQVIGDTAVVDGVWTHVAITYDRVNNKAVTYVNGVAQGSPTDISIVGDGALDWSLGTIGRTPDITDVDDRFFGGLIDDVRIYDRPLWSNEIRALAR